ncbi:hypothetical protein [Alkalihalobacillus sp. TS-13]|uniref:hypothetical protein n=1 Tax=Alkalihalobacillus sp. TS-13 TaxID=2842455 RepID=UPI001C86AA21|nr:hypothetical protein [Alkalihalobacillus sp. TS-13]
METQKTAFARFLNRCNTIGPKMFRALNNCGIAGMTATKNGPKPRNSNQLENVLVGDRPFRPNRKEKAAAIGPSQRESRRPIL